jgi:DNA-binding FadR family transcriptional regulator
VPGKDTTNGNLSDYVRQHLIAHIRTNQLRSGAIAPSEMKISADLGVSRGIVREAFRALKAAGILEISNGRAPRVGRINDEGIGQVLQHAISTEQATIEQVLDLRAALEIRAAELAAANRTEEDVHSLHQMVESMRDAKKRPRQFMESDARFHEIIASATGNPLFVLIRGAIDVSLRETIRTGLKNRTKQNELEHIVLNHERIASAISDQDVRGVRKHMIAHFEEAQISVRLGRDRTWKRRGARRRKAVVVSNPRRKESLSSSSEQ